MDDKMKFEPPKSNHRECGETCRAYGFSPAWMLRGKLILTCCTPCLAGMFLPMNGELKRLRADLEGLK